MKNQSDNKESINKKIIASLRAQARKGVGASSTRAPARGWIRRGNKYQALIGVGRHKVYLGTFDTAAAAAEAYAQALAQRERVRAEASPEQAPR